MKPGADPDLDAVFEQTARGVRGLGWSVAGCLMRAWFALACLLFGVAFAIVLGASVASVVLRLFGVPK